MHKHKTQKTGKFRENSLREVAEQPPEEEEPGGPKKGGEEDFDKIVPALKIQIPDYFPEYSSRSQYAIEYLQQQNCFIRPKIECDFGRKDISYYIHSRLEVNDLELFIESLYETLSRVYDTPFEE